MISSDDKIILIFIAIVFGIGWVGFQLGVQTTEQNIDKEFKTCLEEKAKLEVENEELKQSMSNLIIELYTKQVAFDLIGFKKHRVVFCTLQKHLTGEIPVIGELLC